MSWYEDAIGHYPLWCVPYRMARRYDWIAEDYLDGVLEPDLFVDIAVYGLAQPRGRNYYAEIENALLDVRGLKTLISHNFFEEKTFWKVWSKPAYDEAKRTLDPRGLLPDLYRKTHA